MTAAASKLRDENRENINSAESAKEERGKSKRIARKVRKKNEDSSKDEHGEYMRKEA